MPKRVLNVVALTRCHIPIYPFQSRSPFSAIIFTKNIEY
jgi:hypothetical protein